MMSVVIKAVLTAAFIVAVSEIAKRSTLIASLMVALPMATILTVANIYIGDGDAARATRFATTTLFLVPPGLSFFIVLILAQKAGLHFWPSFGLSLIATAASCWAFIYLARRFGIAL